MEEQTPETPAYSPGELGLMILLHVQGMAQLVLAAVFVLFKWPAAAGVPEIAAIALLHAAAFAAIAASLALLLKFAQSKKLVALVSVLLAASGAGGLVFFHSAWLGLPIVSVGAIIAAAAAQALLRRF